MRAVDVDIIGVETTQAVFGRATQMVALRAPWRAPLPKLVGLAIGGFEEVDAGLEAYVDEAGALPASVWLPALNTHLYPQNVAARS